MQAEGLFVAPLAPGPVPAEVVVGIERGGDLDVLVLTARIDGPGGFALVGLGALADGVHRFEVELEPGGLYEVWLDLYGVAEETGAASAAIRLAVDSPLPEPGAPVQLALGALMVAFLRRRGRSPGSLTGR